MSSDSDVFIMMYISRLKKNPHRRSSIVTPVKNHFIFPSALIFFSFERVFSSCKFSSLDSSTWLDFNYAAPPPFFSRRTDRKLAWGNPAEWSIDIEIERGREQNIRERNIIYSWWLYNDSYYPIDCLLLMATLVCPLYISPPSFLLTKAKCQCGNSGHWEGSYRHEILAMKRPLRKRSGNVQCLLSHCILGRQNIIHEGGQACPTLPHSALTCYFWRPAWTQGC